MLGAGLAAWVISSRNEAPAAGQKYIVDQPEHMETLRSEHDRLSATVNAAESQLNIERSAQKQLVIQVKALEVDNAKLKEDLAFFESLLPANATAQGVTIRRLKAEAVAPSQLRYQLLIMQGGKGPAQFNGSLQLAVSVVQGGKNAVIHFPDHASASSDKFKLAFRQYQRVEGTLNLPEGAAVRSVQARILNNGQVRTQLSTNL